MPKYFMQDTPLEEFERIMMQTPYPRGPDDEDKKETEAKQASAWQSQTEKHIPLMPCGE